MADITMCVVEKCPKAHNCYRKNAIPNKYRQSYADFTESCNLENNYQYYYIRESVYLGSQEQEKPNE